MKRLVLFLIPVLLAALLVASVAHGQPVDSGSGQGAGWSVSVAGAGQEANAVLVPSAVAVIPNPCPSNPQPCEAHATNQLLNASVLGTVATANALRSAADAYKVAGASATLQAEIQAGHTLAANEARPPLPVLTLPTLWNTRGYARVEGFSALNGAIVADTIESEAVSGTRTTDGGFVTVSGAGARVVNLRLAGTRLGEQLAEIIPGEVNQVLYNENGLRIVLWETNWDPATATTPIDPATGQPEPVWVIALHITDSNANIDIKVAESRAESVYVAPPPPVESPSPSESPSESPTPSESPSESPTPQESPSESPTPDPSPSDTGGGGGTGGGNNPPVPEDDEATTPQGTTVRIPVASNDHDPDDNLNPGSVVITSHPTNGAVTCANGECSYTPAPGFTGTDSFVYRICDTDNACATATVTITVTAGGGGGGGGSPPVAVDDSASTPRDTSVSINVVSNDSDVDGDLDPSSVRITRHPYRGAVTCSGGTCVYTPAAGFFGTDTFEYRVCDLAGACSTATVTVTVTPDGGGGGSGNNPPVARDDSTTTEPGQPVTIVVVGNDDDPDDDLDPSSTAIVHHPANGAATCSDGTCTYTPAPGFTGTDSFTYQVCDATSACTTAVVTVTVGTSGGGGGGTGGGTGGGSPPDARNDSTTTPAGTPVVIGVTPNDSDPDGDLDPSTVKIIDGPDHGSVVCTGGVCTYTPDAGFTGSDSFTYEVCDSTGKCDQATVDITVIGSPPSTGGGTGGGVSGNDPDDIDGGIERPDDNTKPPGRGGGSGDGSDGDPNDDGGPGGGDGSDGDGPRLDQSSGTPDGSSSLFGAPAGPGLPFTGPPTPLFLALALNLVTAGGLLMLFGSRRRLMAATSSPAPTASVVVAAKAPTPAKKTAAAKTKAASAKTQTTKKSTVARTKTAYSSKRKSTVRKTTRRVAPTN